MARIVICCDGTWNSAVKEGKTNIFRISELITPTDSSGTRQLTYYDTGIGTEGPFDKMIGGLTGKGIDKNIQDAYLYLVNNYQVGDEVFLFGFSRGAYTVRSLAGMINNIGILEKKHADKLAMAFDIYRSRLDEDRPHGSHADKFQQDYAHQGHVDFLGVFDTVGALGFPDGQLDDAHKFHDTTLSKCIKTARHALAVDEKRYNFYHTDWQAKPGTDSIQKWFPGVHSDVGGGYSDSHALSDVALEWMVNEAKACGLEVNWENYQEFLPNPDGKLHDSYSTMFSAMGFNKRHVCDAKQTGNTDGAHPHPFTTDHSWFKSTRATSQYNRAWWDVFGLFTGNDKGLCNHPDHQFSKALETRLGAKKGYAPSNVLTKVIHTEMKSNYAWWDLFRWFPSKPEPAQAPMAASVSETTTPVL